jgi:hypothetical protein
MSETRHYSPESDEPERRLSPLAESELNAYESFEKLDAIARGWLKGEPDVTKEMLNAALAEFEEAVSRRNAEEDLLRRPSDETSGPE